MTSAEAGRRRWKVLGALGSLAVIAAAAVITPVGEHIVSAFFKPEGRLEAVDLLVQNPHSPVNGEPIPATLDIRAHNTGEARVIAKRVNVQVEDVLRLKSCDTQGEFPVTGKYEIRLPPDAKPGDSFSHSLEQQIGKDEADRFTLRLQHQVNEGIETVEPTFYRLLVSVEATGDASTVLFGTAIVGLPRLPNNAEGAYLWDVDYQSGKSNIDWMKPAMRDRVRSCMQANSKALAAFLAKPGARSTEVEGIQATLR
ncbi:hypothetical protein [Micromonospora humida]|uniref:hypothetical protein n=1 Tax=Micromonospora humida TaxID=2809018 RepID=UPI0033DB4CB5